MGTHVLIGTDNITVKAYIKRQGGMRSSTLMKEVILLLLRAEEILLSLRAEHLAGEVNTYSNWLSRQQLNYYEQQLNPSVFQQIVDQFGLPAVDLFTSKANTQLHLQNSTSSGRKCGCSTMPLEAGSSLCLPPVQLLPLFLRRVRQQGARVILVAPFWPRRPCFVDIVRLLSGPGWHLPGIRDLLVQGPCLHPQAHLFRLTA